MTPLNTVVRACSLGILVTVFGCGLISPTIPNIYLTETDSGSTVAVAVEGRVIVTLASNATTGYQWQLVDLNQSILANTNQQYLSPVSSAIGAGGQERWEFTARAEGTTRLRLEYRGPDGSPAADPNDIFQITANVTAAP